MNSSLYWKKVSTVFGGTAAAQAIPLLGYVLIARIYAPENYGLFAAWLGISQLIAVGLTYRLEAAFGLEPDGKLRTYFVAATVSLVVLTGTILLIVVIVVQIAIGLFTYSIPKALVWLLIPQSVGMALFMVWQSWAAYNGDLKKLASIRISQALLTTTLQVSTGLFFPTTTALSASQALAMWLTVLLCLRMLPLRHVLTAPLWQTLFTLIKQHWKKYYRFPLLALPADLINTAAAQLPVLIISSRFGTEIAGYYALAARMMGAPIFLLGGAVRDVFGRTANEEIRILGHCRAVYLRTFWVLLGLSVLMVATVTILAEPLAALAFGQQWAQVGIIAVWLVPRYAFGFMASPLSYTFYVAQKQNVDLLWQLGLLIMTALMLLAFDSYRQTLYYYSGGYALMYVFYLALSWRCCSPASETESLRKK